MRAIKQRVAALREILERHNQLYYIADAPEISDREYDRLYAELESLEKQYPELVTLQSPTQRIGGMPQRQFRSVRHRIPMLSLANTYNRAELLAFDERVKKLLPGVSFSYVLEPKIDGAAIALRYEKGQLVYGSTRGDGKTGDDITANLRVIRSIPELLRSDRPPAVLEVRGEVFMPRQGFLAINRAREAAGLEPFANPRNAAAGSIKLLDPRLVAKRPLDVVLYGVGELDGIEFATHRELIAALQAFGFKTPPRSWDCASMAAALSALEELAGIRRDLPFDTDGGVIKINDRALYAELGTTAKNPRWAVAFKYEPERVKTRLRSITLQVGRTGVLTPVAELEPVLVGGSTINRATLHNMDEIRRKDIRIGDQVYLEKAGEVIPALLGVDLAARSGRETIFNMPSHCPVCGGVISHRAGEVSYRCENMQCPAQLKRWLRHFAARGAMDIEGLGTALIDQLVDQKLVSDPADLYTLTHEQIRLLQRMANKSSQNLLASIAASKRRDFWRVIFALGIHQIGTKMAQILEQNFEDIDQLMRADAAQLGQIHTLGPIAAQSLVDYFKQARNQALIKRLQDAGINFKRREIPTAASKLAGKTFVLTGRLAHFTREQAALAIQRHGGSIVSGVSSKTAYVVTGAEPGSKLTKARSLGVKVLDEAAFLALLGDGHTNSLPTG